MSIESHKQRINNLKEPITVPVNVFNIYRQQQRETIGKPILPLTEEEIAKKPFQDRVAYIRGQQTAFQEYAKKLFPETVETEEGKETAYTPREQTLHLAGIVLDFDTRRQETELLEKEFSALDRQYQQEKSAIRAGKRGKRSHAKKIAKAQQSCQEKKAELERKFGSLEAKEALQNTALDIFIKDYFLEADGIEDFILSTTDLVDNGIIKEKTILKLIASAQQRLESYESRESARFFSYKKGADNFIFPNQAEALRQIINRAITEPDPARPLSSGITNTARTLIEFI